LESDTGVEIRHGCGVSDSAKKLRHGCPGNTGSKFISTKDIVYKVMDLLWRKHILKVDGSYPSEREIQLTTIKTWPNLIW